MRVHVTAYLATAVVFFTLDLLWLGWLARDFYRGQLGALARPTPILPVAAAFYALYVVGIVIFAVAPAIEAGSWRTAAMLGALFGFFAYATYDLTNIATLRDWPVRMSVVDLAWGTALTAASAAAGYWLTRQLGAT